MKSPSLHNITKKALWFFLPWRFSWSTTHPLFSVMKNHEKRWLPPTPFAWCNYWTAPNCKNVSSFYNYFTSVDLNEFPHEIKKIIFNLKHTIHFNKLYRSTFTQAIINFPKSQILPYLTIPSSTQHLRYLIIYYNIDIFNYDI